MNICDFELYLTDIHDGEITRNGHLTLRTLKNRLILGCSLPILMSTCVWPVSVMAAVGLFNPFNTAGGSRQHIKNISDNLEFH